MYERLTGRRVWSETQQLLSLQWASSEELQARSEAKLRALLRHAYGHTGYYRDLFRCAGLTLDDIRSPEDFAVIPVTTKRALQANDLHRVLADNLPAERRWPARTTGSTGFPLEFYSDAGAQDARAASLDFFRIWAGITPTDSGIVLANPGHQEHSYPVREGSRGLLTGRRTYYLSVPDVTLTTFCETVCSVSTYFLQGYPSHVARLVREVERQGIRLPAYPKVFFNNSEIVSPFEAEQITHGLRCPVVEHYESVEFQSMAQSCPDNPTMLHVNSESVLLEIVNEKGMPALPGERGRVIVTDLHNYVMPFIRYDLEDSAVAAGPCPCGRGFPALARLEGRSSEHIRTSEGHLVTAAILGEALFVRKRFAACVVEYQALQTDLHAIALKIVPSELFDRQTEGALRACVSEIFGPDMQVALEIVDQIPREASGKRLLIKSQISPS